MQGGHSLQSWRPRPSRSPPPAQLLDDSGSNAATVGWIDSTVEAGLRHFEELLNGGGKADHVNIKGSFRGGAPPDAATLGVYRLLLLVRTGEDLDSPRAIGRGLSDPRVVFAQPSPAEDYDRLQEKRGAADAIFSSLPCADPDPGQIKGEHSMFTAAIWDYLLWLRDDYSAVRGRASQLRAAEAHK